MRRHPLFDREGDPEWITAEFAVARGVTVINQPIAVLYMGGIGVSIYLTSIVGLWALLSVPGWFVLGWLWWSYAVPRWRAWALANGAPPERLQARAVEAKLLWPKGSLWEKTEIPVSRGDGA